MRQAIISGLIALFAFSNSANANEFNWDLNDISVLFPVPQQPSDTTEHLIPAKTDGAFGALLPKDVYTNLPPILNSGNGNETLYKGALRVVSIRFDPCSTFDSNACKPEIRLVWQPIEFSDFDNSWKTRDGAAHSFYRLTTEEMNQVTEKLYQLKLDMADMGVSTEGKPLNVHPAFLNPATKDLFNKKLQKIVLNYCGEKNLFKVTFMSLLVKTRWWRFGGFEKDNFGKWSSPIIPRLDNNIVDVFNTATETNGNRGPGKNLDGMFNVLPENYPEEDNIFQLISKSYRNNDDSDLPVFEEKLNALARFKNPHITSAQNLDCSSCHFADVANHFAKKTFPELNDFISDFAYQNPEPEQFNLENTTISKEATRIIRAFGYFEGQPAILQRTINDSAASAHWLNVN